MSNNVDVMIVGCGNIGMEYCKVVKAQGKNPLVIGRGEKKAREFEKEMGVRVIAGGLETALQNMSSVPEYAIAAVDVVNLSSVTVSLLNAGVKNVLVEKPAGLSREEIQSICQASNYAKAKVYIAYNRRFYASTKRALQIIEEDGKRVSSVNFEFTEWSNIISKLDVPDRVKQCTLLGNSSHVIDLAFFFAGHPKEISAYVGGGLPWHSNGSVYAGAGYTDKGVMFSYNANWNAPGRWAVEVLTERHRLYFKPMEKLSVQNLNSVKVEEAIIDDSKDIAFKPGFYEEVFAFLNNQKDERLISAEEHLKNITYYEIIAGLDSNSVHIK